MKGKKGVSQLNDKNMEENDEEEPNLSNINKKRRMILRSSDLKYGSKQTQN